MAGSFGALKLTTEISIRLNTEYLCATCRRNLDTEEYRLSLVIVRAIFVLEPGSSRVSQRARGVCQCQLSVRRTPEVRLLISEPVPNR